MDNDAKHIFLKEALIEAEKAGKRDEVPIGAVIVQNNTIIARAGNRVEEHQDPTAHAEMIVIRQATQKLNQKRLLDCDLYVSLEPCTMCAGAIAMARLRSIIFAADDPKGGGILHGARFFEQNTCHHKPIIEHADGVHGESSARLLKEFFKRKRL